MNLDFDSLLAALPAAEGEDGTTLSQARRVLRVGFPRLRRWQTEGLTVRDAEDVADALKVHPSEVWDYWWTALDEQIERDLAAQGQVCAADDCDAAFVPYRANGPKAQRFCSKRCKNRVEARKWRSKNRAYVRDANRRYYGECRVAVLAKVRIYHQANSDRINARRRAQRKVA